MVRNKCVDRFYYLIDVIDLSAIALWLPEVQKAFITFKAPSLKTKRKVYQASVRQCMIYSCETLPMLTKHQLWLERSEIRTLRWMNGSKLSEKRSNNELRKAMVAEQSGAPMSCVRVVSVG